jgi:large subunit ribosomal protein L35
MERVHQMNVIPDVLPELHPNFDLHVTVRRPHKELRKSTKSNAVYEPGVFFTPDQTLTPPTLYANVFHTDTRLYTMMLVDPGM